MRLHFFPALLPLASFFPWLLGAVGSLAGAFYSRDTRSRTKHVLLAGALSITVGFASVAIYFRSWRDPPSSRMTSILDLPKLEVAPEEPSKPGRDASRADRSSAGASHSPGPTSGGLTELWSVVTPRKPLSAPAVTGDLVLIGTWEGTLDAFDRRSGALRWSLKKSEPVFARPALAPGSAPAQAAFAGEGLHHSRASALTALSLPSGKPRWQRELAGHIETPPLLSPRADRLWLTAGPGGVWCVDPGNGRVIWHQPMGHADMTPALDAGTLYVSVQPDEKEPRSELHALDPETGASRWKATLPGQPWGSPVIREGAAMVTTGIGQVGKPDKTNRGWAHALDLKSGKLRWTFDLPGVPLFAAPFDDALKLLIVTLATGQVLALEPERGAVVWRTDLRHPVHAPAVLAGTPERRKVLVSDTAGVLHVLDARDGGEIQAVAITPDATSSPEVADDIAYVAAPGMLAAFRIR